MKKIIPLFMTVCAVAIQASQESHRVDPANGIVTVAIPAAVAQPQLQLRLDEKLKRYYGIVRVAVPAAVEQPQPGLKLGDKLKLLAITVPNEEFSFFIDKDGNIKQERKPSPNGFFVKHIDSSVFFKDLNPKIKPETLKRYVTESKLLRSLACQDPKDPYFYLTSTAPRETEITPPITNIRMWISRVEAPKEALDPFIKNMNDLGERIGDVLLYVINKKYIPETIRYLKEKLPRIRIIELGKIDENDKLTLTLGGCETKKNDSLPKELVEQLLNHPAGYTDNGDPLYYYTAASNILRPYVLFAHGGIYCDLGAEIQPIGIKYARRFDHTFVCRTVHGSLLEGYIAGIKNSPIFRELLKFYVNFPRVPFAYMQAMDKRNTGGIGLLSSEVYQQFILTNLGRTSWFTAPEGLTVKFNSIGTWRIDGSHGNMPTFENQSSKAKKITAKFLLSLFGERILTQSDPYGAIISNYAHATCPLVSKITEHFHGLPEAVIKTARQRNHEVIQSILKGEATVDPQNQIPHIFHSIWLTNPDEPSDIQDYMLRSAQKSKENLKDFTAILWTNNPNYLESGFSLSPYDQIRSIEELRTDMDGKEFFEELYGYKRFANASILLRYAALNKMGGIYADAGTLLKPAMRDALEKFDYVFSQRDFTQPENWLGENMMASRANAPLWQTLFHYFRQLTVKKMHDTPVHNDFKAVVRYMPLNEDHAWISGHALSSAIDFIIAEGTATVLPCCFNSLFHSGSSGSWYGNGKFGSVNFRAPEVKVQFVHFPQ